MIKKFNLPVHTTIFPSPNWYEAKYPLCSWLLGWNTKKPSLVIVLLSPPLRAGYLKEVLRLQALDSQTFNPEL